MPGRGGAGSWQVAEMEQGVGVERGPGANGWDLDILLLREWESTKKAEKAQEQDQESLDH